MSFDPEKIERDMGDCDFGYGRFGYDVVQASDYDQLLTLYRQKSAGEWTKDRPTMPGLYWWRGSQHDDPRGVKIEESSAYSEQRGYADELVVFWPGNDNGCPLLDINGEFWSEPIAPPETA